MYKNAKIKNTLLLAILSVLVITPVFAEDQLIDDPIYIFATVLTELAQIFLSIWRVIYVLFEIFAIIFTLLTLPILIFKTIKWGIKEVFVK